MISLLDMMTEYMIGARTKDDLTTTSSEGAYIKVSEHQKGEHQIKRPCERMNNLLFRRFDNQAVRYEQYFTLPHTSRLVPGSPWSPCVESRQNV